MTTAIIIILFLICLMSLDTDWNAFCDIVEEIKEKQAQEENQKQEDAS